MHPPTERLYFLDWLRIGAFALLVLYHVGMYYVTWSWHVKSADASAALEPFMRLVVAVAAVAAVPDLGGGHVVHAVARRGQPPPGFGGRSKRLLLPLLFGMAVIVPPQSYFDGVVQQLYGYARQLLRFHGGCYSRRPRRLLQSRAAPAWILPTWNHLWFVAYLFVYSAALLAAAARAAAGAAIHRSGAGACAARRRLVVAADRGCWRCFLRVSALIRALPADARAGRRCLPARDVLRAVHRRRRVGAGCRHVATLRRAALARARPGTAGVAGDDRVAAVARRHAGRARAVGMAGAHAVRDHAVVGHRRGGRLRARAPEPRPPLARHAGRQRVSGVHRAPDADRVVRDDAGTAALGAGARRSVAGGAHVRRQLRRLSRGAPRAGLAHGVRPEHRPGRRRRHTPARHASAHRERRLVRAAEHHAGGHRAPRLRSALPSRRLLRVSTNDTGPSISSNIDRSAGAPLAPACRAGAPARSRAPGSRWPS